MTGMTTTADRLTPRQREITELFLSGKTYKDVAAQFGIAPSTINPTLKAVRKKVGAAGIGRKHLKKALAEQ